MPDYAKARAHAAMKGLDPKDFMYVDGISFGRAASIFMESDADYETIKALIDKKYYKRWLYGIYAVEKFEKDHISMMIAWQQV